MSGRRRPNGTRSSLYGIEPFFNQFSFLKPVCGSFCRLDSPIRQFPIMCETETEDACAKPVTTVISCELSGQIAIQFIPMPDVIVSLNPNRPGAKT